jgi:hypothetical protein
MTRDTIACCIVLTTTNLTLAVDSASGQPAKTESVAWRTFDSAANGAVVDGGADRNDRVEGNFKLLRGVVRNALLFDVALDDLKICNGAVLPSEVAETFSAAAPVPHCEIGLHRLGRAPSGRAVRDDVDAPLDNNEAGKPNVTRFRKVKGKYL